MIDLDPQARDESTRLHVALYELHTDLAAAARAAWRYSLGLLGQSGSGLALGQRRKIDRDIERACRAITRHEHAASEHLAELEHRRCRVRSIAEVLGQDEADRVLTELTRRVI